VTPSVSYLTGWQWH